MKRFDIFISIVLSILLGSCDAQSLPSSTPDLVEHIYSRGIIDGTSLPLNSQALFNTTGHTPINNEVFTFNGEVWENENMQIPVGTQSLTALYPAYNGNTFITINPYTENALEDVLISQNAITDQTNLNLEFKHLFAKLTIHVISAINETLTGVSVTVPKVSAINPIDGSLTFSGEHSTYLSCTSTGDYTFIIPSKENCPLKLTFSFENEDDIEKEITHTFVSGYQYECNVTDTDTRPGIKTVQDLIDFSLFINEESDDRPWSDFGYIEGEDTVYCLLNDLVITSEDDSKIAKLYPIGYYDKKAFNQIFDGKGHTISNLTYPEENTTNKRSGLFGYIGANGVVKNLHLDKAKTLTTPTCTYIGGIAAYNYGLIINCSVQNSTFYATKGARIGGISSRLSAGYIVNCSTSENTIYSNEGTFTGGIVGDANGYILNCYTYKNTFNITKKNDETKNGGLVGTNSPDYKLTIANCYVNHSSLSSTYSANAVGNAQYVSIDNFMYNLNTNICLTEGKKVEINNEQRYPTSTFSVGETHISTILNNWIDNPNRTEYKDIPFKHWTKTNPPTFTESSR